MVSMAREPLGQIDGRQRSLRPLSRLWPYVLRYRAMLAAALFFLLLASGTTLSLPLAVRRMIDHGFSAADSAFITQYFSMLVMLAGVLAFASASRYYFVTMIGERVVADVRRDVFAHVVTLSPAFFDRSHSGEIVSRLTADTTQIKSAVGVSVSIALRDTILAVGSLGMMIYTSPKLSAVAIAAMPVILLPLIGFGRSVRKRSRKAQDMLAGATAYASEQISSVRTLQAFTNESLVTDRFAQSVDAALQTARRSTLARTVLTFFGVFAIFGSIVGILWLGAQDVLSGAMSAGTLGQYLIYAVMAAGALGALSEVWAELAQASGAAERLTELLAEKPAIAAPVKPKALPVPPRGAIEFRGVSFSYEAQSDRSALHDLSFRIAPGETVAIVGPSGAGKTTIFSLLLRYYDAETGSVLIDGVDVRDADPAEIRKRIALVPQDPTVFAASVADNIGFGRPGAGREEIVAAARTALATDFIEKMPSGYDTVVGERGMTLSGGQRQRIAIARAVLRDAPILLLDEATSALDAESETLVQQALEHLMQHRTTLVIAHRLATVLKADRILVMNEGRIVEEGTHASLVAKGGIYARLAKLQFETGASAFQAAE